MENYIHVDCSQCGGSCKGLCVESGLPVRGGLYASPESIAEIKSRIPLLRLQRMQRSQLLELIGKAEEIGAWLYSTDARPHRSFASYEMPDPPKFHKARDVVKEEIGYWYSPAELRAKLDFTNPNNHHSEDLYRFHWSLRYPEDGVKELKFIVDEINKMYSEFCKRAGCQWAT